VSRRPAALMAFALVAVLLLGTAGPAAAAPPAIIISEPEDGALVTSPGAKLVGEARTQDLDRVTSTITAVVITVSGPSGRRECSDCWSPSGPDATFSVPLDFNGPYSVSVKVTRADIVGSEASEATRSFRVEVPPAQPQDVRVEVGPDRRATISWVRNTEPDLSRYVVTRVAPGGGTSPVDSVPQPPSGERVSVVDEQVPPAGGSYRYVVVAVRPGADGTLARPATSSAEGAVEVAGAPTGGDAGPGVGTGPGTAAGTARRPAAGARGPGGLPSLLSGLGGEQTLPAVPEGEALPVDDGFALPGAEGSEAADPAVLVDSGSPLNERALFVPIAAGLFLTVLALHLRRFSRAVLDAPAAYHPLLEADSDDDAGGDGRADGAKREAASEKAVLVGARRPPREG
jgi:hypothetical protein